MNQTTETPAVSGLAVLEIASRLVAGLGTWQYHPALSVDIRNSVIGDPQVMVGLVSSMTDPATRAEFMSDLCRVVGADAESHSNDRGVLASVSVHNWSGTGVDVYSSAYITEATR